MYASSYSLNHGNHLSNPSKNSCTVTARIITGHPNNFRDMH